GRCRGVINEHRPLTHAAIGAILAEGYFAQIIVVTHAAHDKVLALCGGFGCGRAAAAKLRNPFLGLGGGAIINRKLIAAFVLEMSCHGITNDAETEKSHLRHPALRPHKPDRLDRALLGGTQRCCRGTMLGLVKSSTQPTATSNHPCLYPQHGSDERPGACGA